eukprot:CAMPEP_0170461700 /NCGR_PEP_ID=MMETSP0123-20130129/7499_1 /TAXON_ID=182087 /ORGANISM="Favella ehrenbergii, Strain Fehren 1" /LENGTH=164 /DNA_ID=CAMNT_0010726769 /DNA_START=135 /DNA_END=629 /DNA_ORIENTATION=-
MAFGGPNTIGFSTAKQSSSKKCSAAGNSVHLSMFKLGNRTLLAWETMKRISCMISGPELAVTATALREALSATLLWIKDAIVARMGARRAKNATTGMVWHRLSKIVSMVSDIAASAALKPSMNLSDQSRTRMTQTDTSAGMGTWRAMKISLINLVVKITSSAAA